MLWRAPIRFESLASLCEHRIFADRFNVPEFKNCIINAMQVRNTIA